MIERTETNDLILQQSLGSHSQHMANEGGQDESNEPTLGVSGNCFVEANQA